MRDNDACIPDTQYQPERKREKGTEGVKEGKICEGCQMLPLQIFSSAPLPR